MNKSSPKTFITPVVSLIHREVARFLCVPVQTILTPIIRAFLYVVIFGINMEKYIDNGGIPYMHFLISGLVAMSIATSSYENSSSSIMISKFQGESEALHVAPLHPWQFICGISIGATIRGIIVSIGIIIMGTIFTAIDDKSPIFTIKFPVLLFVLSIIVGTTFANVGLLMALRAKNFDQVNSIGTLVITPLIYLGGVFLPINKLSPLWQTASNYNPLFHLINAIRFSIMEIGSFPALSIFLSTIILAASYFLTFKYIKHGSYTRW